LAGCFDDDVLRAEAGLGSLGLFFGVFFGAFLGVFFLAIRAVYSTFILIARIISANKAPHPHLNRP